MRFCFFFLLALVAASHSTLHAQPAVPAQYTDLYTLLDTKIDAMNSYLDTQWDGTRGSTAFMTNLLVANGNRGEALLAPQTMQGVVVTLERLKEIGFHGCDIALNYPLLVPGFPRSSEYLQFYKTVASEMRKRGLKLFIGVGPVFRDTSWSTVPIEEYYNGLTFERYKAEKASMIQTIIDELQPEFLTLENEPKTMEMNIGLDFSVANVTDVLNYFLSAVDKKTTKLGAGAGSWDNPAYINAMLQMQNLDYIDAHIYPLNRSYFYDRVTTIAEQAAQAGKGFIIGETWLYKVRDSEVDNSTASSPEFFSRDVFSFWQPLDEYYIRTIFKLSHYTKSWLTNLFWMRYFYAYLDYTPQLDALPPAQLMAACDQQAAPNIVSGTLSPIGTLVKNLLAEIVAVEDVSAASPNALSLSVYPNPSSGNATITLEPRQYGHASVRVYDSFGREAAVVYEGFVEPSRKEIALNAVALATGVYRVVAMVDGRMSSVPVAVR